jgi:hypothetical protein
LLRLAEGETKAAAGAIGRVVTETSDRLRRAKLLPAHVEIMLAAGGIPAAREAADELCQIVDVYDTRPCVRRPDTHSAASCSPRAKPDSRSASCAVHGSSGRLSMRHTRPPVSPLPSLLSRSKACRRGFDGPRRDRRDQMMTHTSEEVLSASGEVNRAQRDYWETDGPLQYQQFGDTNEALLGPPGEAMLDAPDLGAPGAPGPFAFADGDRLTQLLAGGGFRDVRLETLTQPFRIGRTVGEAVNFILSLRESKRLFAGAPQDTIDAAATACMPASRPTPESREWYRRPRPGW